MQFRLRTCIMKKRIEYSTKMYVVLMDKRNNIQSIEIESLRYVC